MGAGGFGGGFGGQAGWLRMFNAQVGTQVSWLLLLAAAFSADDSKKAVLCAPPPDKASPSLPAKLMKGMGEVSGTTKKPYRQKGTGNARQGSLL